MTLFYAFTSGKLFYLRRTSLFPASFFVSSELSTSSIQLFRRDGTKETYSCKGAWLCLPSSWRCRPQQLVWIQFQNAEQEARYNYLVEQKITNTRYLDIHWLTTLRLYDDVAWMFEQIGWQHFLLLAQPTYIPLTLNSSTSWRSKWITMMVETHELFPSTWPILTIHLLCSNSTRFMIFLKMAQGSAPWI